MNIDPAAEDLGREAVRASIARDMNALALAQEAIADADASLRVQVIPIYLAVARSALRNTYHGKVPSQEQNKSMAETLKREEPWAPVDAQDVYELLEGLSSDDYQPDISADKLPPTLFLTVGYLLSRYDEPLGYNDFYHYLDEILNRLTSQN